LFSSGQQEYANDAQLRTHVVIEKKITSALSVNLGQQSRFTKNMTTFSRSAIDLGVTYKITRNIRLSADYIFIHRLNKYNTFNTRNRYNVAATFRTKKDRWTFLYRNLFQIREGNMNTDETHLIKYYDRNKVTVKYEATKRFTFYIGEEAYVPLNDPTWKGINRTRSYLGTEINLTRSQTLEFYFMYQARFNNSNWFKQTKSYDNSPLRRDYIYGVAYSFSF
jgi:hypothetical protein